jgi:hypothetical protein
MALKHKLETLEGLAEPVAKEYKEVVEGDKKHYILDLDGAYVSDEPIDALKNAKNYEKKARQDAEKKAKESDTKLLSLQEEIDEMRRGNIPKGDVEKLEKSWKEKMDKAVVDRDTQIQARDKTLQRILVENIANKMAGEISAAPDLILPHIKARLTTELNDGEYVTRVLDKDGKPSALGIEELQKEITADKRFSLIIKGSKASGGGASGDGSGGGKGRSGASPTIDLSKPFDPNKATPMELVAYQKAQKEARSRAGTGG